MAQRFPMIDFDGIAIGLFEPGFGALMARRAVQTLVDRFVRDGGNYLQGAAQCRRTRRAPARRELRLSSGERIAADRFVFALGPWLPKLFPDVIGPQDPADPAGGVLLRAAGRRPPLPAGAMPGWADFNGGDIFYGFPDLESARGQVRARRARRRRSIPTRRTAARREAALAEIIAFRDRRFPLLTGAPLTEARVCQYENSSNGDFLIDFHPQLENVLLVGGGSGHGFKHGPEVGRYAARATVGSVEPEPRFSLATKSEDPPPRGALVGLLRHPDQRRAQQPVLDHVAGLHFLDDRARLGLVGRDFDHRLVAVRVERLADRLDAADAVAREHRFELARGRFDPGEELARASCRARSSSVTATSARSRWSLIASMSRANRPRHRLDACCLLGFEPAAHVLGFGRGVERLAVGLLELLLELGHAVVLGQLGRASAVSLRISSASSCSFLVFVVMPSISSVLSR